MNVKRIRVDHVGWIYVFQNRGLSLVYLECDNTILGSIKVEKFWTS
jgi:hypothetical protein